jgi:hypothetical protein
VTDHTQERLQRIEERVASLDNTVSILAAVDDAMAKARIEEVFGDDPSMVIIYRGVEKSLSQTQIAAELRKRGLKGADQARVSTACAFMLDKRFLKKKEPKGYAVREGWEPFGLDKYLKQVLRSRKPPVEPVG